MKNNKKIMHDYIKKCSSISVAKICKNSGIDATTISKGTASEEKIKEVYYFLLRENLNNLIEVLKNYESTIL